MSARTLRIVTFNLALFQLKFCGKTFMEVPYRQERLEAIIPALLASDADIICLQEVYNSDHKDAIEIGVRSKYPHVARKDDDGVIKLSNGLLILSKFPIVDSSFVAFRAGPRAEKFVLDRGALAVRLDVDGIGRVNLFNVHATAGGLGEPEESGSNQIRDAQLAELDSIADKFGKGRSIICGDFNAGPEASPSNYRGMLSLGYYDAFAAKLGESAGKIEFATWDPKNWLNMTSRYAESPAQRIDHLFIPDSLRESITIDSVEVVFREPSVPVKDVGLITLSDHYGLRVTLTWRY